MRGSTSSKPSSATGIVDRLVSDAGRPVRPGDGILHPAALTALAILVLNDQVLKRLWPGLVTGKLSDIAGLVLLPTALVAGWEIGRSSFRRPWGPSRRALLTALVVSGVFFTAIQVWPPADEAFRVGLGIAQWPVRALVASIRGSAVGGPEPVASVADAEDLLAIPALAIAWWIGRDRLRVGGRHPG